jgi:hypothetical protein
MCEHEDDHVVLYGDEYIKSYHGIVPTWLKYQYALWIVAGMVWFFLYWNGSWGYLDRGSWQQLQRAALTTFPQMDESLQTVEK